MPRLSDLNTNAAFDRLLVIDDNPSIHKDFQKILAPDRESHNCDALAASLFGKSPRQELAKKFEIDNAFQGEEGLAKVAAAVRQGRPYGMAFVDMRMPPGWDGPETISRLWQEDPAMQIVICTAYSDYDWTQLTDKLGVSDQLLVLKKPFDCVEVTQLAIALCEKRRLLHLARQQTENLEKTVETRTAQLRELAESDPLTKLPNRAVFNNRLQRCVDRRKGGAETFDAVMLLDIDNFKLVNDSLGHQAGDALLLQVTDRLKRCMRSTDTVSTDDSCLFARLGGDEFAILVRDLRNQAGARAIADRMLRVMRKPFQINGRSITVGISIGVAMVDNDEQDASEVLRKSDIAMYESKAAGKNRALVFDEEMHRRLVTRIDLETDLRRALDTEQFELYWQPIVELATMRISGHEALLRWNCSDGIQRLPADFIATSEESGLIVPLGDWVICRALQFVANHRQLYTGPERLTVNVNITRRQLMEKDFVDNVKRHLSDYDVDGGCVNFEITESTVMHDPEGMVKTLQKVRDLGIHLYLDDFGTGYSSLSCLLRFPIDLLKIDRSFISGESREHSAIVEAILSMASALGIGVVAEGIEKDSRQLEQLRLLECQYGQGFLLGKPCPQNEVFRHHVAVDLDPKSAKNGDFVDAS